MIIHFRLWAEIFKVVATEGELGWERVSEDVVPINITCIQDSPETVFQVTAYSRHVEKIFDTRLIQPGKFDAFKRVRYRKNIMDL